MTADILTRDQRRSQRKRNVRPLTLYMVRTSKAEAAQRRALWPDTDHWRPTLRSECADVPRPCPYVGCRHHLYLDVTSFGSLTLNFPDLEPWELEHSCSLDVADAGKSTAEMVGDLMNITRERIRQVESAARQRMKGAA